MWLNNDANTAKERSKNATQTQSDIEFDTMMFKIASQTRQEYE
jgi:hypothetical protein